MSITVADGLLEKTLSAEKWVRRKKHRELPDISDSFENPPGRTVG
jgi:hypothetical protein